jgi:hypothetical protein
MQLLSDPQEFYRRAGTRLRKAMNKVIFSRLYIESGEITGHELSEAAQPLVEADSAARVYYRRSELLEAAPTAQEAVYDTSLFLAEEAGWSNFSDADLLAVTLAGHGSSRDVVVELRGFEPLTPSYRKSRSRACR